MNLQWRKGFTWTRGISILIPWNYRSTSSSEALAVLSGVVFSIFKSSKPSDLNYSPGNDHISHVSRQVRRIINSKMPQESMPKENLVQMIFLISTWVLFRNSNCNFPGWNCQLTLWCSFPESSVASFSSLDISGMCSLSGAGHCGVWKHTCHKPATLKHLFKGLFQLGVSESFYGKLLF